jgi:hypothetical protein
MQQRWRKEQFHRLPQSTVLSNFLCSETIFSSERLIAPRTARFANVREFKSLSRVARFFGTICQNGVKYTKLTLHYQIAIKYIKWP